MRDNPITPTVPFDTDGAHHGFLRLPYSRDDSAWGAIMIPITVIRNGEGATALLTGGNHGDEYEGPIALQELALKLSPKEVKGRVIIIPALNYPAFRAGRRTSPIDNGNMNRCFPGTPDGSISQKIADYVARILLPMTDVALDFHSGGKTLDFVPLAAVHHLADKTQQAACTAAMRAFNAPYSMMMLEIDSVGMYDTTAEEQGKVFVTTELGGGGTASVKTVAIARKGVHNLLKHAGIIAGQPETAPTVMLHMPDERCFVFAQDAGMLEPLADLGETVRQNQPFARLWPTARTGQPPFMYSAQLDGIIAGRHFPGLVQAGDCLAVVAVAGEKHPPAARIIAGR